MSNPSEDPKVTHNRAVVGSARNRRDVASWLDIVPADTSGDAPPTTNEEVPAFEAENETSGAGTKSAVDEILSSRPSVVNNLLENMLGKKGAKQHLLARAGAQHHTAVKSRTDGVKGKVAKRSAEEDYSDDEDEGRVGMFKSRAKLGAVKAADVGDEAGQDDGKAAGEGGVATKNKRKAVAGGGGSYLDQILAEKGSKKRSKKIS